MSLPPTNTQTDEPSQLVSLDQHGATNNGTLKHSQALRITNPTMEQVRPPQGHGPDQDSDKIPLWVWGALAATLFIEVGEKVLEVLDSRIETPLLPMRSPFSRPLTPPARPAIDFVSRNRALTERQAANISPPPSLTPQPPLQLSHIDADVLQAVKQKLLTDASTPSWIPPRDARWLDIAPYPSVTLVVGKRGSGKSALGYRLLELNRDRAVPYVGDLPPSARRLLPEWVGVMDRLEDVPPGAVILLDEAYVNLHARNSMSREGRDIGTIVKGSRQKSQSLIFIVQEAR